jgi:hypothetical protein
MAVAKFARPWMMNDPRPRRLRAPALTWYAVHAPTDIELVAADHHGKALLDRLHLREVPLYAVLLVRGETPCVVGFPARLEAERLVDAGAQPRLRKLAPARRLDCLLCCPLPTFFDMFMRYLPAFPGGECRNIC